MNEKLPTRPKEGLQETQEVSVEVTGKDTPIEKPVTKQESTITPEAVKKDIEETAVPAEKIREKITLEEEQQLQYHPGDHKTLKQVAFRQTLQSVQSRLSGAERLLSKLVHNQTADMVSNIAARSIARPAGILGSGVVGLLGSSVLLYLSKEFGYAYNYFSFLALMVVGYVFGVVFEFIIRAIKNRR